MPRDTELCTRARGPTGSAATDRDLTHPNAQADPARQWLKSAIMETAGDLTYAARRVSGKR